MGFEEDRDIFRNFAGVSVHVPLCRLSPLAELPSALSWPWLLHPVPLLFLSEGLYLVPIKLKEIVGMNPGWRGEGDLWQFVPEHQIPQTTYITTSRAWRHFSALREEIRRAALCIILKMWVTLIFVLEYSIKQKSTL